ncbi:hypothetical protein ACVWY0_003237 [Arthrobacter sp. UYNi723]
MKRTGVWNYGVPLVLIGTLMTSCGAQTSDGQGPSVSAPSSTSLSLAPTIPVTSATSPTSSTPPQETCAAFLPSAPCAIYTSTSGTAGGKNLPWVASGSLRVQLNSINGDLYLSVRTNCAPISGPVEITGNTMTAGDLAIGAIGCPEEISRQDQWVLEFLKRPVEMTFSQHTLQWKSGADTLSFKSADS